MWLTERNSKGRCPSQRPVPPALRQALIRWYEGHGTKDDEAAGIALVQQIRRGHQWLACDCLAADHPPPLMTPAYLSHAETYYLRRLTGPNRPEHRTDCPFFRDQATARLAAVAEGRPPSRPPDGLFSVLRPDPEKLARRPASDMVDDRTRHENLPQLARLLRRLLATARCHVAMSANGSQEDDTQLKLVRAAAAAIEIAPGVALDRLLWFGAEAWHNGRAQSVLRTRAANWPRGHAPQGFLLVRTRAFRGHMVEPCDGRPLRIANRVQGLATAERPVSGPYVTLIVIGQYPDTGRWEPLRAFAHPVRHGSSLFPIEHDLERAMLETLLVAGAEVGHDILIEKPLFDLVTPCGECRPNLLVASRQRSAGSEERFALHIAVQGIEPPAGLRHLGRPVIVKDFGSFTENSTADR